MTGTLALPTTVADLIDEYSDKAGSVDETIAEFNRAFDRLGLATCVAGVFVEPVGSRSFLHASSLRSNLLKSGWRAVYDRLQIASVASAADRKRFDQAMADPPPLTMETAKATFGDYLLRPRFHILKGLAEAFTTLDPAYKSHSKVRVGVKGLPKRVVLQNWGGYSSTYGRYRFRDMANALAAVRGQVPVDWPEMLDIDDQHKAGEDAVMNGRALNRRNIGGQDEQFTAPCRGLTVRRFGNGNAHVFFDRDALLAVNRGLAEFYGEVLPDAEAEGVKPSVSTAVSKDLQFYWSPPAVVNAALERAEVHGAGSYSPSYQRPVLRVLEPSCGDGRVLDEIEARGHRGFGIEYHAGRAAEARAKGHPVLTANFLEHPAAAEFDAVVMNPPFYGRHWVKHLNHALLFVRPGGVLVAVLPATARYDHELAVPDGFRFDWSDLPVASFADAGTNVPTTLLRVYAPREGK